MHDYQWWVLRQMRRANWLPLWEIARDVGLHIMQVEQQVDLLAKAGMVAPRGDGFGLTALGERTMAVLEPSS